MSTDIEHQLHLGGSQDGRRQTGSSNKIARVIGKNVISKANTMFSMVADTMDRRPTPSTSCI
jgi:hypothetical protein